IVGATVVSLGTTSPECGVSVMAAWSGHPGLALGNAIGSIIADTGLIFGLGCLLTTLPAERFVLTRQGWVQFGSALFLSLLCYGAWLRAGADAALGRWAGVVLLLLLAGYLYVSVGWSRRHRRGEPFQIDDTIDTRRKARPAAGRLLLLCVVGLVMVLLASRALILSVTELAEAHWHVPQVVIAATFVALGTSLPELVIGMTSILKGHREILVGNVIGADVLNVLFVVGASALAAPLSIADPAARLPLILLVVHLPVMLVILALFRLFIHTACRAGHFHRWQGWPLVLIYVGYVVVQYLIA
ncbi:MAG TPA: sodium:calcium antiporter, partial [Candidatus Polarisedimenticolia bacterium]|nr:sodium:calcium antiporter [Candidatus Polarisedimenticolia bacterium]